MRDTRAPRTLFVTVLLAFLTALPVRASAPLGRYTLETDVVLDNDTGLIWQRSAATTLRTWSVAMSYCNGLVLGGYSDWRLPNVRELQSLVDVRAAAPSIDATAFPEASTGYHWSASLITSFAWYVDFASGTTNWYATTAVARARCVR